MITVTILNRMQNRVKGLDDYNNNNYYLADRRRLVRVLSIGAEPHPSFFSAFVTI